MIPNEQQAKALWDKYNLPEKKRVHVTWIAKLALFLADRVMYHVSSVKINKELLQAAALLHDIDKAIPRLPGEQHPDTGVRVLREEGMNEVADIVKTHSLHAILDPAICPKSWEEKLLYLADKMVKQDIIGVDKRFAMWNDEHLPDDAQKMLDACYPEVKKLEKEIFSLIHINASDVASFVS